MRIYTKEGYAPFRDYVTWYRVTGDPSSKKPPVVLLHGGPGAAHDYLDAYKLLARHGRQVIHYDQLGCGKSTLLPDKGADFWTPQLFVAELNSLIDHLAIRSAYHVLGQSWGGMLGAEFGITRPKGLKTLTIANSPASMELWVSEANRLRSEMPEKVRVALNRHEEAGTVTDPEYLAATMAFYERHVCRVVPFPPEVKRSFDQIGCNPTVYNTMNGPNEFFVIGSLKTWSVIDKVSAINVPTLLISGRYDEATPAVVQPFADNIKGARWVVMEKSSHLPHVEETAKCIKTVAEFLDEND
jgi:L-proline amide hydrolase